MLKRRRAKFASMTDEKIDRQIDFENKFLFALGCACLLMTATIAARGPELALIWLAVIGTPFAVYSTMNYYDLAAEQSQRKKLYDAMDNALEPEITDPWDEAS